MRSVFPLEAMLKDINDATDNSQVINTGSTVSTSW